MIAISFPSYRRVTKKMCLWGEVPNGSFRWRGLSAPSGSPVQAASLRFVRKS